MSIELKDNEEIKRRWQIMGGGGQSAALQGTVPECVGQTFQRSHEIQWEPSKAGFWYAAGICLLIYLKPSVEDIVWL